MLSLEESPMIEEVIREHQLRPELHLAQKHLAYSVTKLIHGSELTEAAKTLSEMLFERSFASSKISNPENILSSTRFRSFPATGITSNLTALAFLVQIFPEHSKGKFFGSKLYYLN